MGNEFRIGLICGKLGDVDGVSLEVSKWIKILGEAGHSIITIAGRYVSELDLVEPRNQILCEEIQFGSPEQTYYEKLVFPHLHRRPPHISEEKKKEIADSLEIEGNEIANILFEHVLEKDIDVIVAQNTNAMPMTLLGGMGVYKLATEQRIATIFHHHDFWWERSRFSHNHIESLLARIMPPTDPGLEHIVLSSYAAHILRSLKRVHPVVIPNCEDFDNVVSIDDYNSDLRKELGFSDNDILVVQPTRIVRRKRIEDSVALVGRLIEIHPEYLGRIRFIVSLYQGDEPDENYINEITEQAAQGGFQVHLISDRIAAQRGVDDEGRKLYTNRDVLASADLVTYLPMWEGFGNAFLEAIAAKVPVVVATYLVYKTDIKIMGFKVVEILDNYDEEGRLRIPDEIVEELHHLLTHPEDRGRMVERNFQIGRRYFGFDSLRRKITDVMDHYGDEIRASRKRIKKSKTPYSV